MYGETTAQKEKRIADIRAALASTPALSDDDKKALIGLNFSEFRQVISAHTGHRLNGKLESLTAAREQFDMACTDLLVMLEEFHAFSDTPMFGSPDGRVQIELIITRLRKELFTFSGLAHSVQDHCRLVQKVWNAPSFREQLAQHFGTDGLHEFVIALRNALHHLYVFDVAGELRWDSDGEKASRFNLTKEDLLNDHDEWRNGKPWLDAAPDKIDMRSLVAAYQARHQAFYDWYLGWAAAHLPAEVAEYRELRLEQRRSLARSGWDFLLRQFLNRGINPIEHLNKYLTTDQVVLASKLPQKSKELVDFVITCVDTTGGCTPELREMGYKLFNVPGATWEAPKPPEVATKLVLIPGPGVLR
jgi:hypothetical protein